MIEQGEIVMLVVEDRIQGNLKRNLWLQQQPRKLSTCKGQAVYCLQSDGECLQRPDGSFKGYQCPHTDSMVSGNGMSAVELS